MKKKYITIAELVKLGGLSKQAVYKHVRAGKLTFKDGQADPVKLLAEWRRKADPTRDDKIGPALDRMIQDRGLAPQERPASARTNQKRLTVAQDAPESARDGIPGHLSPEMRRFWKQVTSEFDLESDSLLILRTACSAFDRAEEARKLIEKEGLVVNGRRHAAADIEAQSQSLALRAMR